MIDEQKLRELAEAATPGPWITEDWASKDSDGAINVCGTSVMSPKAVCGIFTVALEGDETSDVDFIAAANPAAIIALLDELQSLLSERTAWRVSAENAEKDATRYRWLKSRPMECPTTGPDLAHWDNHAGESIRGEEADAAIDAAMKETP